jgi:hypothetical protein
MACGSALGACPARRRPDADCRLQRDVREAGSPREVDRSDPVTGDASASLERTGLRTLNRFRTRFAWCPAEAEPSSCSSMPP